MMFLCDFSVMWLILDDGLQVFDRSVDFLCIKLRLSRFGSLYIWIVLWYKWFNCFLYVLLFCQWLAWCMSNWFVLIDFELIPSLVDLYILFVVYFVSECIGFYWCLVDNSHSAYKVCHELLCWLTWWEMAAVISFSVFLFDLTCVLLSTY